MNYNFQNVIPGGQKTEIRFGKDEFILALKESDQPASVSISYQALPVASKLPDTRWNVTQLDVTDIEASDAFWTANIKAGGLDKAAALKKWNDVFKAAPFYVLLSPGEDGSHPILSMLVDYDGIRTYRFDQVVISGSSITGQYAFGASTKGSITLTVNGDQISGTIRDSEITALTKETKEWLTTVIRITAVRAPTPAPASSSSR